MHKKTLKEYRLLQHLSQQELADRSRVSLRTIQRIEKDGSSGSPYVIRSLCEALNIETGSLMMEKIDVGHKDCNGEDMAVINTHSIVNVATLEKAMANKYLKYINFSALLVFLCPFFNLVTVPVLYFHFKKKLMIPTQRAVALKIISFQILWSVVTLILLVFTPLMDYWFLHLGEMLEIPLFIWVYLVLIFSHLIITLKIAARLSEKAEPMPYIPNFF